jgi:hypothetical protein
MAMSKSASLKASVRHELEKAAKAGRFPYYAEVAANVGMKPRGPWKKMLDEISSEQKSMGLPDITFVLMNKTTRYPGQIGMVLARSPTNEQKKLARKKAQEVVDKYHPGAQNPF